jgi:hypothetical protein
MRKISVLLAPPFPILLPAPSKVKALRQIAAVRGKIFWQCTWHGHLARGEFHGRPGNVA